MNQTSVFEYQVFLNMFYWTSASNSLYVFHVGYTSFCVQAVAPNGVLEALRAHVYVLNVGDTCFCIQTESPNGVLEAPSDEGYTHFYVQTEAPNGVMEAPRAHLYMFNVGYTCFCAQTEALAGSKNLFIHGQSRLYVFLCTKWSSGWRFVGLIAHLCVFNVGYMCFCVQSDAPKRFWEAPGIHLYSSKMLFVRPNARNLYVFLWVRACFEEFLELSGPSEGQR